MNMDDMLRIGVVASAHGIKGEVKVYPTTDDPMRYKKLKKVFLWDGRELTEHEIGGARFFKNMVILAIKDITDRDMAEKIRKRELWIRRADALPLEEDEYFITDLVGLKVVSDDDGSLIGILRDVITTGANDVYEIEADESFTPGGRGPKERVFYAPAIKDCIKAVDIKAGEVRMYLMPGLID